MSGWEVGDLALCVEGGLLTSSGAVYTVNEVVAPGSQVDGTVNRHGITGLGFVGVDRPYRHLADERRFRKIRPDQHEDCEPEFVTLLNRIKRPAKQGETA